MKTAKDKLKLTQTNVLKPNHMVKKKDFIVQTRNIMSYFT